MDSLAPPPYTEVVDTSNAASQSIRASLRGGYMRPSLPSEMPIVENNRSAAITYLEDRDEPDLNQAGINLSLVENTITLDSETTRDDLAFPLPIDIYNARDVTSLDWSTFVHFLFPMHDEVRNGNLRQQKGPHRHSFVEENTPARRDRLLAVIAEWNENFFNPRGIHINADFSPLPSCPSRPTAIPSAAQGPFVGSRPLQPAQPNMYRDPPAEWTGNPSASQPIHRSLTNSSSGSSFSSSLDSIKSTDLEGTDLGQIRSALLAFQLDATKRDHLRASVRQLRDEFRSQRQDLSGRDSKELKQQYRKQRKEMKKEVKAVMKEVKATRRADRKIRRAERKSHREDKRAEHRGSDRIKNPQDKGLMVEERAAERVRRAQERGREGEGRASEKAARAHERAREVQAQAVARAEERAADARARGREGEAVATQRAQEIKARAGAAGRRAKETAGRARYENDGGQETGVLPELAPSTAAKGSEGSKYLTRSHKQNDRDHAGLADGTAEESQHLPRYFAKSGHVDADPKKVKKEGGGKGNWGTPGDESQDYGYNFTNARRRSNSSSHGHAIGDFKTKFEAVEADPVFEEEYHGAKGNAKIDEHLGLEKSDSADSISGGSVEEEEHAKKV